MKSALRYAEGDAGLYRAEQELASADVLGGWIVLPDGRQRGVTVCIGGGPVEICVDIMSGPSGKISTK